jgi:predicted transcriptional regulator
MDWINEFVSILQGQRRLKIVSQITQPLTCTQLAYRTKIRVRSCSQALIELENLGVVYCLTPDAPSSRLYYLTETGKECQKQWYQINGLKPPEHDYPKIDWNRYQSLCYKHRSLVIQLLTEPIQPAVLRRKARINHPEIKMSSNNARNVMYFLRTQGYVNIVRIRGKEHLRYELNEEGQEFQRLLLKAHSQTHEIPTNIK